MSDHLAASFGPSTCILLPVVRISILHRSPSLLIPCARCSTPDMLSRPPNSPVLSYATLPRPSLSAHSSADSSSSSLSTMPQQQGANAPLPSPSKEKTQYFGSLAASSQQQPPQQHAPGGRSSGLPGAAGSSAGGYNQSLQNFNLVAEAAKRAQIAVVARELEEITL